jgi:archaellum component FlaC
MSLHSAVSALSDKIQSIAEANPNAEDLAMLGTAVERIGGRATIADVVKMGEEVKSQIDALDTATQTDLRAKVDALTNEIIALSATAKQSLSDHVAQLHAQTAFLNVFHSSI